MVTLGNGATQAVQTRSRASARNLLHGAAGPAPRARAAAPPARRRSRSTTREAIAAQIGRHRARSRRSADARRHGGRTATRNWSTSVTGTTQRLVRRRGNWTLAPGRIFSDAELRAGARSASSARPCGASCSATQRPGRREHLRVKQFSCEVIGVLAPKGQVELRPGPGRHRRRAAQHPAAARHRQPDVNTLLVSMRRRRPTDAGASASIARCCASAASIAAGDEDNFNVLDTQQIAETLSGTTQRADDAARRGRRGQPAGRRHRHHEHHAGQSVTERTREIGIAAGHRRAGARGAAAVPDRGGGAGRARRPDRHRARAPSRRSCWRS